MTRKATGAKVVGVISLRRGRTTENKPVYATVWKTKCGSTFYLTGKTRKYLNKDHQKSRIVFSHVPDKTTDDTDNVDVDDSVRRGGSDPSTPSKEVQDEGTE